MCLASVPTPSPFLVKSNSVEATRDLNCCCWATPSIGSSYFASDYIPNLSTIHGPEKAHLLPLYWCPCLKLSSTMTF